MAVANLSRWLGLCQDVQADDEAAVRVYSRLLRAYETPMRAYHNLVHVMQCLRSFDSWRGECDHPAVVELAIWFHDAVYDTHRTDNEEQSALLARELLAEMKVAGWVAQDVERVILGTRHQAPAETADERVMQDVDLAILAAPADIFDAYNEAIRHEYAWVEENVYRRKRSEFLQGLLSRSQIFLTTSAHQACEAAACENIERALSALRGGGSR